MWLLFGFAAILTACLNVAWTLRRREAKWFRFLSLAFTAFTLCDFYSQVNGWVAMSYWGALMDVVPTASKMLWVLTAGSVVINSVSLWKQADR